jgi:hypothetical protein
VNLKQRAAKLEKNFLTRSPEAQDALINLVRSVFLVFGNNGLLPAEDLAAVVDILQNVGGKMQRGLMAQAAIMSELSEGAPVLTGRVLAALQAPPAT